MTIEPLIRLIVGCWALNFSVLGVAHLHIPEHLRLKPRCAEIARLAFRGVV